MSLLSSIRRSKERSSRIGVLSAAAEAGTLPAPAALLLLAALAAAVNSSGSAPRGGDMRGYGNSDLAADPRREPGLGLLEPTPLDRESGLPSWGLG